MNLGNWLGISLLIVALYILWQVRQLLLFVFAAVVLATALNILVEWLIRRFKLKRKSGVILAALLAILGLVGFIGLIVPPFLSQIEELPTKVQEGANQINSWFKLIENHLDPELLQSLPTLKDLSQEFPSLTNQILGEGWNLFSNTLTVLLNLLFILVLTLMFLAEPQPYRQGFIRLFPSFYRERADKILILCEDSLQRWLEGIAINMVMVGLLSFIALSVLQIPLALSQAVIAGFLTLIPTLGVALSLVPPVTIALLDNPWKPLLVLIFYIGIQQLETNLLTPLVMKKQTAFLPAVTLLAQLFFTFFFGIPGLFLALPLTIILEIWLKEALIKDIFEQWKPANASLSTVDSSLSENAQPSLSEEE